MRETPRWSHPQDRQEQDHSKVATRGEKELMKIIGVVQVKGGAGRSTVATNIAGELAKTYQTVLVDCDMPQGSALSWAALRNNWHPGLRVETVTNHRELVAIVERLKPDTELSLMDHRA